MAQLLDQDDQTLTYANPDGTTFKVAKQFVNQDTLQSIMPSPAEEAGPNMSIDPSLISNANPNAPQMKPADPFGGPKNVLVAEDETGSVYSTPGGENFRIEKPKPEPSMLEKNFGLQESGLIKEYKAGADEAFRKAGEFKAAEQIQNQEIEQQAQRNQAREQASSEAITKLQGLNDDVARFQLRDPWSSASTASRISGAIAIALGEIGGAVTGRENVGLKIINETIDRDVKLQLDQLKQKQGVADNQRQFYNELEKKFATDDQRALALRDLKLGAIETRLKTIGAESQNKQLLAKLEAGQGLIRNERQKAALQLADMAATLADKQYTLAAKQTGIANYDPEKDIPNVGYAKNATKEEAKELRSQVADINGANDSINLLRQINQEGGGSLSLKQRARAETIVQSLIGQLRVPLTGPGILNESEREALKGIIKNPTNFLSLKNVNEAGLVQLEELLQNAVKRKAQSVGVDASSFKQPKQKQNAAIDNMKASAQRVLASDPKNQEALTALKNIEGMLSGR